jgi:hypothetical protein
MLFSAKTRAVLFIVFAVLGAMAALYHLTGIFYTINAAPGWRHLLFVIINLFCVYGVLKRPGYFTWFFGALLVQQYYSHGFYLLKLWNEQQRIHWISVLDLVLLPIVLVCLIDDRRNRKR